MLSRLIEKYWVEVALNQGSAFRMSVSPAGALGISQFICSTYARILDESPEVRLDPVFVYGMQNHVNAIKASITLFDSDMSSWWIPATRKICSASAEILEDCWAASYNGGPNRGMHLTPVQTICTHWPVVFRGCRYYILGLLVSSAYPYRLNRVVARYGKEWDKQGPMMRNAHRHFASRFREETYTYLDKLRSIREHLLTLEKSVPSIPASSNDGGSSSNVDP